MFFKKTKNRSVSVTLESKKTVVIIDGKEIDLGENHGDIDLLSILKNHGVNIDLIPESVLSTISNSLTANTLTTSADSSVQVNCSACSRTVSFGKGNCLYCGNPLKLPQKVTLDEVVNEVDAKYLNTEEVESNDTVADADINYVDRLKDI